MPRLDNSRSTCLTTCWSAALAPAPDPPLSRGQALADHADRQRRGLDHPERGPGQRLHPFGVQVVAEQRVEEAVNTVEGKWLTHRQA
jgi:hypothetical protein